MAKIIVSYDQEGNSLDVWWGDPTKEEFSHEVEEESGLMLKKDKAGQTIGIEILNCLPEEVLEKGQPVEMELADEKGTLILKRIKGRKDD